MTNMDCLSICSSRLFHHCFCFDAKPFILSFCWKLPACSYLSPCNRLFSPLPRSRWDIAICCAYGLTRRVEKVLPPSHPTAPFPISVLSCCPPILRCKWLSHETVLSSLLIVVLEAMMKQTGCQKWEASWSNLHSPCPYLLTYAQRSQWSIGHQRLPGIALCSGLLLSFRISWSPAVSALLQCLASSCCEAGLSSSSPAGSTSGLGVWCWMLASWGCVRSSPTSSAVSAWPLVPVPLAPTDLHFGSSLAIGFCRCVSDRCWRMSGSFVASSVLSPCLTSVKQDWLHIGVDLEPCPCWCGLQESGLVLHLAVIVWQERQVISEVEVV